MPRGIKTGPKGHQKATKAEVEKRVELVAQWILEHPDARWRDYQAWAQPKFDVQRPQADEYRKRAMAKLDKITPDGLEASKRVAVSSLKIMLDKAMDDGDHKLAFSIRQELNKIQGLYTQKIEVNDVTEQPLFNIVPKVIKTKEE